MATNHEIGPDELTAEEYDNLFREDLFNWLMSCLRIMDGKQRIGREFGTAIYDFHDSNFDYGEYRDLRPGRRRNVSPERIIEGRKRTMRLLGDQRFKDAGFVLIPLEITEFVNLSDEAGCIIARSKFGAAALEEITYIDKTTSQPSGYEALLVFPCPAELDEELTDELRKAA